MNFYMFTKHIKSEKYEYFYKKIMKNLLNISLRIEKHNT